MNCVGNICGMQVFTVVQQLGQFQSEDEVHSSLSQVLAEWELLFKVGPLPGPVVLLAFCMHEHCWSHTNGMCCGWQVRWQSCCLMVPTGVEGQWRVVRLVRP
jgi:hypothetical protein